MKIEFSGQVLEKYKNFKFHENLLSGNQVVQCWQTDGRTDKYDEVNVAKAPKNATEKASSLQPIY